MAIDESTQCIILPINFCEITAKTNELIDKVFPNLPNNYRYGTELFVCESESQLAVEAVTGQLKDHRLIVEKLFQTTYTLFGMRSYLRLRTVFVRFVVFSKNCNKGYKRKRLHTSVNSLKAEKEVASFQFAIEGGGKDKFSTGSSSPSLHFVSSPLIIGYEGFIQLSRNIAINYLLLLAMSPGNRVWYNYNFVMYKTSINNVKSNVREYGAEQKAKRDISLNFPCRGMIPNVNFKITLRDKTKPKKICRINGWSSELECFSLQLLLRYFDTVYLTFIISCGLKYNVSIPDSFFADSDGFSVPTTIRLYEISSKLNIYINMCKQRGSDSIISGRSEACAVLGDVIKVQQHNNSVFIFATNVATTITYEELCIKFSNILTRQKNFYRHFKKKFSKKLKISVLKKSQNILRIKSCKENDNSNNW
ncbi:hypothetical protein AGLY_015756 [Aphis glycines]|uniref:Uncharacterized protein n=1 Tax=Aphis glycines TaxID=307491 RepID=A0A6G0T0E1_APHGL|nr:hypothetical protein AGLY_015756 [Aphis glycines]